MLGEFTNLTPEGSAGPTRVALHKLGPAGEGQPGFGSGGLIRYGPVPRQPKKTAATKP